MKYESTIATFKENITYLTKGGFKPVFNIIDNVASKAFKKYLKEKNIIIQLVEPHNHHMNASEHAKKRSRITQLQASAHVMKVFPLSYGAN